MILRAKFILLRLQVIPRKNIHYIARIRDKNEIYWRPCWRLFLWLNPCVLALDVGKSKLYTRFRLYEMPWRCRTQKLTWIILQENVLSFTATKCRLCSRVQSFYSFFVCLSPSSTSLILFRIPPLKRNAKKDHCRLVSKMDKRRHLNQSPSPQLTWMRLQRSLLTRRWPRWGWGCSSRWRDWGFPRWRRRAPRAWPDGSEWCAGRNRRRQRHALTPLSSAVSWNRSLGLCRSTPRPQTAGESICSPFARREACFHGWVIRAMIIDGLRFCIMIKWLKKESLPAKSVDGQGFVMKRDLILHTLKKKRKRKA